MGSPAFPVWFSYHVDSLEVPFWASAQAADSESCYSSCELVLYNTKIRRYAVFDRRLLFDSAGEALSFIRRVLSDGPLEVPDEVHWLGLFYEEDPEEEVSDTSLCVSMPEILRSRIKKKRGHR